MIISFESESFPGGTPSDGHDSLVVTWSEILWAAATVGRPNLYYVFRYGFPSLHEFIFRCSLVLMSLERDPGTDRVVRTEAFKALDPTEKGAVTYFLGLVVCKLFAARKLDAHWMLHFDVFRSQLDAKVANGRSRPDLVGQHRISGEWFAFECKGRVRAPGLKEKEKAKDQAERIISIDNAPCSLNVGAISFFQGDELAFYWCDPASTSSKAIELSSPAQWGAYYAPLADALLLSSGEGPSPVERELDIKIDAHPAILPFLLERDWRAARQTAQNLSPRFLDEGYFADGLYVSAGESWNVRRPGQFRFDIDLF